MSALDVQVGGHLFQEGILGILVKEKKTVILVTHQLEYLESADKVFIRQACPVCQMHNVVMSPCTSRNQGTHH